MNQYLPAENNEYILVRIKGNVKFDVEGILHARIDKMDIHFQLKEYHTFMSNNYVHSIFYHTLQELITYAKTEDGRWFENMWTRTLGIRETYNGIADTLYYDEFLFLLQENLVTFDDFELLSSTKIWANYDTYMKSKEHQENFPELFEAKDLSELRRIFKGLAKKLHPDIVGQESNEKMREVIELYDVLRKQMSVK